MQHVSLDKPTKLLFIKNKTDESINGVSCLPQNGGVCGSETQPGQCCFVFELFFLKEVNATNSSLITDKISLRGKIGAREDHPMTKILLTAVLRPNQTERQNRMFCKVLSI